MTTTKVPGSGSPTWPQNRTNEELLEDIHTCERPLTGVTTADEKWIAARAALHAELLRRTREI